MVDTPEEKSNGQVLKERVTDAYKQYAPIVQEKAGKAYNAGRDWSLKNFIKYEGKINNDNNWKGAGISFLVCAVSTAIPGLRFLEVASGITTGLFGYRAFKDDRATRTEYNKIKMD